MNAKSLYSEFAAKGTGAGPATVFDEYTALDLVNRAHQGGLAISGIEMVRPAELDDVEPLPGRVLRDSERLLSWSQARSFVEMLAGKGLYFQVALETPWSRRLAQLRSLGRMLVRDNTTSRVPP